MKREKSAGGIITKKEGDQTLILLVEHRDETYVFPKGHVKEGETLEQTAKREIYEEVGLKDIEIGEKLGVVTRPSVKSDGRIIKKDITLFAIKVNDFNHSDEAEEDYQWFTLEQALNKFRYKEDADFLRKLKI